MSDRIGFVGLGLMGRPMAVNLLRSGVPLTVWNRSAEALEALVAEGAHAAGSASELVAACDVVVLMLGGEEAIDTTLAGVAARPGQVVVNMGTVSPGYSAALAARIEADGARFVEAPVSGSRRPAEERALVGMIAGDPEAVTRVRPLVELLCASVTDCGVVPQALRMKLAANTFLIALVTGLAEAFHFADRHGLDLAALRGILDAGQMASPISRVKTEKLVSGELSPQASIRDVLMNAELIVDAARAAGIASPLLDASRELYATATARGDGELDMIGVWRAFGDR